MSGTGPGFLPPRFGDGRRMRIGLLGGSFDPAHAGHRLVAETALKCLRLDQVWLLVSPGNPLKRAAGQSPLARRLASAQAIASGRRIVATDVERHFPTAYTVDILRALRRRFPLARFVWLMGADNLVQFPRWRGWLAIARLVPFAVLPRPNYNYAARGGQAAARFARARRPSRQAPALAGSAAPSWIFLSARQTGLSATAIRAAARKTADPGAHVQTPQEKTHRQKADHAHRRGSRPGQAQAAPA